MRMVTQLTLFLILCFSLSYLLDYTLIIPLYSGPTPVAALLVVRMFIVALSAYIVARLSGVKSFSRFIGLDEVNLGKLLPPALVATMVYTIALLIAPILIHVPLRGPILQLAKYMGLPWPILTLLILAVGFLAGFTINALVALGEEAGWRGFMYVLLREKLGLHMTAVIIGVVWGLWHAPLIVHLGYNFGGVGGLDKLMVFTVFTVCVSLVATWFRERSGSLWAPSALHGTINGVAGLYNLLYGFDPSTAVYTPPTGLIVSALFAITYLVLLTSERLRS